MTFGQITLIKRSGEDSGIVCPVTSKGISIGRDLNCQIRVQMPRVSRLHCQVAVENNKVVLKNYSKNSISVNVSKLGRNQSTPMRDGDVFKVMDRSFRYNTHLVDKENMDAEQQASASIPDGNSTLLVETCPVTKQRKISIEVPLDEIPRSLGKRRRSSQVPSEDMSLTKRNRADSIDQSAQPMMKNIKKSLSPLPLDALPESPFHHFNSGWADKRASAISFIDLDSSLECGAMAPDTYEEDPAFVKDPNIAIKEGDAVFQVGQLYKKQVGTAEVFTARTPKAPTCAQRPSSILRKPHTPRRMDAERVSFATCDKVLLTPMNRDSRLSAKLYVTPSKTTSPATRTDELPVLRRVPDEFLDDSEDDVRPSFLDAEEEDEEEEDDYMSQPGDYDISESINPTLLTSILARRSEPEEPEEEEDEEEDEDDQMEEAHSPQQEELSVEPEAIENEQFAVPAITNKSRPRSLPHAASPAPSHGSRFHSMGPTNSQASTPNFAAPLSDPEDEDLVTDQELEADQMLVASNIQSSQRGSLKQLDLDPLSPSESECTPVKAQPLRGSRSTGRGKKLKAIPFSNGPKRAVTPLQARERVRRTQSDAPMPLPMALPSPKAHQRKPVTQHVATPVARAPAPEEEEDKSMEEEEVIESDFAPPAVSLPATEDIEEESVQQSIMDDQPPQVETQEEPEPEVQPEQQTKVVPHTPEAAPAVSVPERSGVHISGGILAKRKRSRRSSTCFSKNQTLADSPPVSPPAKRVRASMAASIPTLGLVTPLSNMSLPSTPLPTEDGSPLCGIPVETASPLQELPVPTTPARKNSFSQTLTRFLKTPVRALGATLFSDANPSASELEPCLFELWKELRNYLRESTDEKLCRGFYENDTAPTMTVMYDRIHSSEYQSVEDLEKDWQLTFRTATQSHENTVMCDALAEFAAKTFDSVRRTQPQKETENWMDDTIEDDLWNVPMKDKSHLVISLPPTPVKSTPVASPAPKKVVTPAVPAILHSMMAESLQVPEPSETEFFSVCSESFASPVLPRRVSDMNSSSADSAPATPAKMATLVESPMASPVEEVAVESPVEEETMDIEPSEHEEEPMAIEEPVEASESSVLNTPPPVMKRRRTIKKIEDDEESDAEPEPEKVEEEVSTVVPVEESANEEPSDVEPSAKDEASVQENVSECPEDEPMEDDMLVEDEASAISMVDEMPVEEEMPAVDPTEEQFELSASELVSAEEDAQSSIDQEAEEQLVPDLSADESSEEEVVEVVAEPSQVEEDHDESEATSQVEKEEATAASDSESEIAVELSGSEPVSPSKGVDVEDESSSESELMMELSEVPEEVSVAQEDSSAPASPVRQTSDDSSSELMELSEVPDLTEEPVEEEKEEAPKVDYNKWTCVMLRKELKSRQLDTKGLKRVLVERLEEDDASPAQEEEASPEPSESSEAVSEVALSEVVSEAVSESVSASETPAPVEEVEESSELVVELSEVSVSDVAPEPTPKVNYNSWTCVVLRKELKKRKLDTKGLKKDLVRRLEENDLDDSASGSPTPVESPVPVKKTKAPVKSTRTAKKAEPESSRPRRSGRRR